MKLSTINNWLCGNISSVEIKAMLEPILKEHQKKLKTKGTSIPLFLTEDIHLVFGNLEFNFLCNSFLMNDINELELSYIAELLLLSSSVYIENEDIEERLEFLCDYDIYGKFSKEDVRRLLKL
ncbi:hypothetical protein [Dysgonomonas reticulitermitis]